MITRRRCTCWGVSCGGLFVLLASATVVDIFVASSSVEIAAVAIVVMEVMSSSHCLFTYGKERFNGKLDTCNMSPKVSSWKQRHTTQAMQNPVASNC